MEQRANFILTYIHINFIDMFNIHTNTHNITTPCVSTSYVLALSLSIHICISISLCIHLYRHNFRWLYNPAETSGAYTAFAKQALL